MSAGPDLERDAHLLAALRHAPDRDRQPPAELSERILAQAHAEARERQGEAARERQRAAARVRQRATDSSGPGWIERWLAWMSQPVAAGALGSVLIAGVVGLMWREGPPADNLAAADRAEPAAAAPAPEAAAPAPAAAPTPAAAGQVSAPAPRPVPPAAPPPAAARSLPPSLQAPEERIAARRAEPAPRPSTSGSGRAVESPDPVPSRASADPPPATRDVRPAAPAAPPAAFPGSPAPAPQPLARSAEEGPAKAKQPPRPVEVQSAVGSSADLAALPGSTSTATASGKAALRERQGPTDSAAGLHTAAAFDPLVPALLELAGESDPTLRLRLQRIQSRVSGPWVEVRPPASDWGEVVRRADGRVLGRLQLQSRLAWWQGSDGLTWQAPLTPANQAP